MLFEYFTSAFPALQFYNMNQHFRAIEESQRIVPDPKASEVKALFHTLFVRGFAVWINHL